VTPRTIDDVIATDVVVVGAGAAGLSVAVSMQPHEVHLLAKGRLGTTGASPLAQGGIASAVGPDDSARRHARDTLAVSGGLGEPEIVDILTRGGPDAIRELVALGAEFDRDSAGGFELGREAAHDRARILHARDTTGAEVVRVLTDAARAAAPVRVFEETFVTSLHMVDGRVGGVAALHPDGGHRLHLAPVVVLATGGVGRVYSRTTNPKEATGDGLALAWRAGARLVDLEFVQFHPTALAVGADPMPLVTEALRGRGGVLLDETGRRFMSELTEMAELAPRDVVARATWAELERGGRVYLDTRDTVGEAFADEFPAVFESCQNHGIDPRREAIPVAPAAHYHMGGVWVDQSSRTSLPGLWACGECASTGAHGANRLASNSLLEALVFGRRLGATLSEQLRTAPRQAAPRPRLVGPVDCVAEPDQAAREEATAALRKLMWENAGLVREAEGLKRTLEGLESISRRLPGRAHGGTETGNLLAVSQLITRAALARPESRGSHFRRDHPEADPAWAQRLVMAPGVNRLRASSSAHPWLQEEAG
jgi:L-aspartate oxidase